MNKNINKLEINDLFIELSDENKRLSNELQFAQRFIKLLQNQRNFLVKCLTNCRNCSENKEIKHKLTDFETDFKSKVTNELVLNKENILKIKRKLREKCFNNLNTNENKPQISETLIESNDCSEDINDFDDNHSISSEEEVINEKSIKLNEKPIDLINTTEKISEQSVEGEGKGSSTQIPNEKDFIISTRVVEKKKRNTKCNFCDYTNSKPYRLSRHVNSQHLNIRPFECELCGTGFHERENYRTHMRAKHPNINYNFCNEKNCEFKTEDSVLFKAHHLTHLDNKQTQIKKIKSKEKLIKYKFEHKCKFCDYRTGRLYIIKDHINRLHLFKCCKCCLIFNDTNELKQHNRDKHPDIVWKLRKPKKHIKKKNTKPRNLRKCRFCEYSCERRSALIYHTKRTHLFKCFKCVLAFDNAVELKRHMNSIHKKEYKCEHKGCDFKTNVMTILKVHNRRHTGERPCACPYPSCQKSYTQSGMLGRHINSVHLNVRTRCEWPGCELLIQPHSMKGHLLKHSAVKKFACVWPGCEAKASTKSLLDSHMLVHSHVKQHSCTWPQCESQFRHRGELKKHLMTHTGERPLKCPVEGCDRTFIEAGNRTRHLKTHRNKV